MLKGFKAKLTREQPFAVMAQFRGMVNSGTFIDELLLTADSKVNLAAQIAVAEIDGWRVTSK